MPAGSGLSTSRRARLMTKKPREPARASHFTTGDWRSGKARSRRPRIAGAKTRKLRRWELIQEVTAAYFRKT
jgi:hypothetical protein